MNNDSSRFRVPVLCLILVNVAGAQQYIISTFAGGAPPPTPIAGTAASFTQPSAVATDSSGNVYFTASQSVSRLDPSGVMTRIAGNSRAGYSGDGAPAINAQLYRPTSLATDRGGNIFILDSFNRRVRRVSSSGIITTIADAPDSSGEAKGIAVDAQGNVYFAGTVFIRKVAPTGIVTTVPGYGGINQYGLPLYHPHDLAVDSRGDLLIADDAGILKAAPDGSISTVLGYASLGGPRAIAVDVQDNIFVATQSCGILKISSNSTVTSVAGDGSSCGYAWDGKVTNAELGQVTALAVDGQGDIFFPDSYGNRIRKVSLAKVITTVAGTGAYGFSGDGGLATSAQLAFRFTEGLGAPIGVAVDESGNLFIADSYNLRIRRVAASGIITTVAGNGTAGYSGDGGLATSASMGVPAGLAVDKQGNLYLADQYNNAVRKVSAAGVISTIAGNGSPGYAGDGGRAANALLNNPIGVAADAKGNVFIADYGNNRVRKVAPDGTITIVAGNGSSGYSGDGGAATAAQLYAESIAVDAQGNVLIGGGSRIRKVASDGTISTLVGNGICSSFCGPSGLATDSAGNILAVDAINNDIRKIAPNGIITTIAGTRLAAGMSPYSGDGGPASAAHISNPAGITVDAQGNLYISDTDNDAVRRLQPTDRSVIVGAVVDAASESAGSVSPGKIVVLYGTGLGPTALTAGQPNDGIYPTQLSGTTVSFNGIAAPILYTSATQVAAIVPYEVTGTIVQVSASYQGQTSTSVIVPLDVTAPSLFTLNQTGAGQAAAINASDGSVNGPAHPVRVGGYISLYATGEGQTLPAGVDGRIAAGSSLPQPLGKVNVTVGGIPAVVQYAGAAPGQVAGLMQVNVQIPTGFLPGGYVPVALQVGNAITVMGAVWIAVAGN